ncbi:MAG: arylsulfatase [Fuerstiella sp.]
MKVLNLLIVLAVAILPVFGQDLHRPNIILMMADDMGLGDTSAYQDLTGNSDQDQIHTPSMQQLARMGVRMADAHTPSSRCSPTRYGLLTGRYPWRNRLKHWVLFGAQGDPMIEADRPTIATLLRDQDYHTGMVGKWHVGLRYRQSSGKPAAAFEDADLRQPLIDTPLDHGFDFCRFTSRSHGTSGPQPGRRNRSDQMIGPGHLHGRDAIGATAAGRQLAGEGRAAYVLSELGGRHSDHALEFLSHHVSDRKTRERPFFLYYASNSNHTPHTPDTQIGGRAVAGAGRNVAGEPMDRRADYVYENDVALGRLLEWLSTTDDPRHPGHSLILNTIVIFTSDNGAEKNSNSATGPYRSNKASCYEGGHRVPFIAAWPAGGVGDGLGGGTGRTSSQLLCLTDLFATFADILQVPLPDNAAGQKGGEDSLSMLAALTGDVVLDRPVFFHDHKEAKDDPAVSVLRLDDPVVGGTGYPGQWKLFFDAMLLRAGTVHPIELYDLATDSGETNNLITEPALEELIDHLSHVALLHRTAGGHRLAEVASPRRIVFSWRPTGSVRAETGSPTESASVVPLADQFHRASVNAQQVSVNGLTMKVSGVPSEGHRRAAEFSVNPNGLGISSGRFQQVDDGEALLISFDSDVIVESAAIVAGNGICGGFYHAGETAPLAIYCVDADIDAKDQSGILSDIGVLRAGEVLKFDSRPHWGVEAAGRWRLGALTVRLLK